MRLRLFLITAAAAASFVLVAMTQPAVGLTEPVRLSLNPAVGPPTTLTKAKGSGYLARELVSLYFDGTRIGSAVVGPTGKFNTQFEVPATARHGEHPTDAVGLSSGVTSRALFLVRRLATAPRRSRT